MSKLELQYRWLMRAYPSNHRARHEDEIVFTLLDVATDGQRRPRFREAVAIITAGLACRVQDSSELNSGLRIAGVAALTATFAAATMAVVLAAQRPIEIGLVPLMAWLAVAAVGFFGAWATSTYRLAPASTLTLIMVAAGPSMMGLRRSILIPAAVFLVLSAFSRPTRRLVRSVAVLAGVLLGLAHGAFISASMNEVFQDADSPWVYDAQWDIASDMAMINPGLLFVVWPMAALAVVLRRQLRYVFAAAVLTAPFVVLAAPFFVLPHSTPTNFPVYVSGFTATLVLAIVIGVPWRQRHRLDQADRSG